MVIVEFDGSPPSSWMVYARVVRPCASDMWTVLQSGGGGPIVLPGSPAGLSVMATVSMHSGPPSGSMSFCVGSKVNDDCPVGYESATAGGGVVGVLWGVGRGGGGAPGGSPGRRL